MQVLDIVVEERGTELLNYVLILGFSMTVYVRRLRDA